MPGVLASCSKSDAATIAADESIVQGNPQPSVVVEDDGHGRVRTCRTVGNGPAKCVTVDQYDNFDDPTSYEDKWLSVSEFFGSEEPEARSSRNSASGALAIEATPFVTSQDYGLDHMKYLALSTRSYEVPLRGSVEVSASITALTPGAVHNRLTSNGRRLTESQQAAATLELVDNGDTGVRFAWYVSQNRAFALYERLTLDGSCDLERTYSQIVQEITIPPGAHTFGIRYLRNTGAAGFGDKVGWLMDGINRAEVRNVGVPIEIRNNRPVTFLAQGPGERLDNRLNRMTIGHGLATMMDEFPYNQCPTIQTNSVPQTQRIFGQGVSATWDNFRVVVEDL